MFEHAETQEERIRASAKVFPAMVNNNNNNNIWLTLIITAFYLLSLHTSSAMPFQGVADSEEIATGGPCFSAIYSFGDSFADTGNLLAHRTGEGAASKVHAGRFPYGLSYFDKPTGRWSDGRLVIDFVTQQLGFPLSSLQPYLSSTSDSVGGGINFAVAGATAVEGSVLASSFGMPLYTAFSLRTQLEWFQSYKAHFCSKYFSGVDCDEYHFGRALFVMGGMGGADYIYHCLSKYNKAQALAEEELQDELGLKIVDEMEAALRIVIGEGGAKNVMLQNIPPLGCLSAARVLFASEEVDKEGCVWGVNAVARRVNRGLKHMAARLRQEHPWVSIFYADVYSAAMNVYRSPWRFRISETRLACCAGGRKDTWSSSGNYDRLAQCGAVDERDGSPLYDTCDNPSTHLDWDGFHFSESANKAIASLLLDGSFSWPAFIPSSLCSVSRDSCTSTSLFLNCHPSS